MTETASPAIFSAKVKRTICFALGEQKLIYVQQRDALAAENDVRSGLENDITYIAGLMKWIQEMPTKVPGCPMLSYQGLTSEGIKSGF